MELNSELDRIKQKNAILFKKLEVAQNALKDISKWDDELENEWGDPGNRANAAIEKIMILDGF